MPQMRRVLNALGAAWRLVRRMRRRPELDGRLAPAAFLAHAEALARQAPGPPPGLWLSVLVDGASTPAKVARLAVAWPKRGPAELVIGEAASSNEAERLNDALARARAPFVARLDASGALTGFALERIAAALAENPQAEMLYTDEIVADRAGALREVALKPAFDPVLLESFDYVGRLAVYRRERLLALGGWRQSCRAEPSSSRDAGAPKPFGTQVSRASASGEVAHSSRPFRDGVSTAEDCALLPSLRSAISADGGPKLAIDYDLALRFSQGLAPAVVVHLPYPAFVGPEPAPDLQGAKAAVAARYRAEGREIDFAPVLAPDRLRATLRREPRAWPKVSVVIPSRDAPALIRAALDGLFEGTDYPDFEVTVVDNGSSDPTTLALYDELGRKRPNFHVERKAEPFNFSRAVNRGVGAFRRSARALAEQRRGGRRAVLAEGDGRLLRLP